MREQHGFGILAYAIAAIVLLGMVGTGVYKIKQWGANEVRAEWAAVNEAARKAEAAKGDAAAKGLEVDRGKTRIIFKTITQTVDREVEKLVYRDVCLPPSGLCLANAALLGKSADTCKPDQSLPAPKPTGGRNRGERVAEAH